MQSQIEIGATQMTRIDVAPDFCPGTIPPLPDVRWEDRLHGTPHHLYRSRDRLTLTTSSYATNKRVIHFSTQHQEKEFALSLLKLSFPPNASLNPAK